VQGLGQLEAYRTKQLIKRFIPPTPAHVVDVGGAAGFYSLWLSSLGYSVHLIDPIARLVDLARANSEASAHPLASCKVGDARAIPADDESADVVLLLGPLYHLQDEADRHRALVESRRVLRQGGLLVAAAISRFAGALDGVIHDFYSNEPHAQRLDASLEDGRYGAPGQDIEKFTTAYFHLPADFRREIEGAALDLLALEGLEGPARMITNFDDDWSDPRRRALLIRLAEQLGPEPSLLGMSGHLLAVARKA